MNDVSWTSQFIASGAILVFLLAGALAAWRHARRPTTNTCCGLSLTAALGGWALATAGGNAVSLGLAPEWIRGLSTLVALLSLFVGFVLALVGLMTRDPRVAPHGVKPAIAALVVVFGPLSLALGYALISNRPSSLPPQDAALAESPPLPADRTATRYVNEECNFSFPAPPAEWRKLDHEKINPIAALMYGNYRRGLFFTIVAEVLPAGMSLTSADLADINTGNQEHVATQVQVESRRERMISGIAGIEQRTSSLIDGAPIKIIAWVAVHNGYAYQLIMSHPQNGSEVGSDQFYQLVEQFQLIDPNRFPRSDVPAPARTHESAEYRYRLTLPSAGWRATPELRKELPGCDYVARLGEEAGVAIIPLPVGATSPIKEDLAAAAATFFGLREEAEPLRDIILLDKIPVLYTERELEGERYAYWFKILEKQPVAFILAGWSPAKISAQCESEVAACMAAFEPLPGEPNTAAVSEPLMRANWARLLNEIALREQQRGELETAAARLADAVEYSLEDPVIFENYVNLGLEAHGPEAMLKSLQALLVTQPGAAPRIGVWQGRLLSDLERPAEAVVAFAAASKFQELAEDDLLSLALAAVTAEQYDEALAVLESAARRKPKLSVRKYYGQLLIRAGQLDAGVAVLEKLAADHPREQLALFALAEAYLDGERYEDARAQCDRIAGGQRATGQLAAGQRASARLEILRGHIELAADNYPEAKQAIDAALQLEPNNAEALELLTHISSQLGRGDNTKIRTPLEPVPLAPEVAAAIAATPLVTAESDYGFTRTFDVLSLEYLPNERVRSTQRSQIHVRTTEGAQVLSPIEFTFDPLRERLFVNEVTVRNRAGKVLGRGELEQYYVLDDDSDGDSYDQRIKVPVPKVALDCTIEIVLTRERLATDALGFRLESLSDLVPVGYAAVTLRGELSRIAQRSSRVTAKPLGGGGLLWEKRLPPVMKLEDCQRPLEYYLPTIYISDAGRTWNQLGTEYLADLAGTLEADARVDAFAQQLVEGVSKPEEQVAKLARHVQSEYAYQAIEFGVRGSIPHSVRVIRKNQFGDCKDHALLLYHFLRAAGQSVQLALVNTSGPVVGALPSLDQFDHMVVCRETKDAAGQPQFEVLDCTTKSFPLGAEPPPGLAARTVLLLDPADPRLVRTRPHASASGRVTCQQLLTIQVEGESAATVAVRERISLAPLQAEFLRAILKGSSPRDRETALKRLIADTGDLELTSCSIRNLEELDKSLTIDLSYTHPEELRDVSTAGLTKLTGDFPTHWEEVFLQTATIPERGSPFELTEPLTLLTETRVVLPAGFKLSNPNPSGANQQAAGVRWRSGTQATAQGFTRKFQLARPVGAYSADRYAPYAKEMNLALRSLRGPLTIEKPRP